MRRGQSGVTLIELIISLALAGVLIGSIWSAWSVLGRRSADPLVARQSLAIAQSLLREIELQPVPGSATAASSPGRTGFAAFTDYHGLDLSPITDAEGTPMPDLQAYRARVTVQPMALSGIPSDQGWWVEVRVTGPTGTDTVLGTWRARR